MSANNHSFPARLRAVAETAFRTAALLSLLLSPLASSGDTLRERLGHATEVVVERVDQIPPGPGGKFQAVVSKLRRNEVTG